MFTILHNDLERFVQLAGDKKLPEGKEWIVYITIPGIYREPLNASQRRKVRRVNSQAATTVSDGTVYRSIGGGVVSAGISAEAVRVSDMLSQDTMLLQTAIEG